jgi:hypothetical protein
MRKSTNMTHAREARLHTVIERMDSGNYFIYDPDTGKQEFEPDSADWFRWLAERTSFHFKAQHGHFTARQEEKKKRDEQTSLSYWYAYRKAYGKQHKRYLGSTDTLTLAKLEEVADELQTAALGSLPDDQVLNTRVHRELLKPQGLTLGPVTFLWHDELLTVKTPTGTEYLTRMQAASLLGYLYDQREAILNKHK